MRNYLDFFRRMFIDGTPLAKPLIDPDATPPSGLPAIPVTEEPDEPERPTDPDYLPAPAARNVAPWQRPWDLSAFGPPTRAR